MTISAEPRAQTTKDLIICAAVDLFNAHGITNVPLRRIAAAAGISHGNLAYHYKNKEVILHEVYSRMDAEMASLLYPDNTTIDLRHYNNVLYAISRFQRRYRFFYIDMLEIQRQYPEVLRRYRDTLAVRRVQTAQLFAALVDNGLLRPEPEPGFYRSLTHALWVLSTFWLQHQVICDPEQTAFDDSTVRHTWMILLPHLTEAGRAQYAAVAAEEETR